MARASLRLMAFARSVFEPTIGSGFFRFRVLREVVFMRVRSLTLALLACSFAVPGVVVAQTPTPGGVQRHDEQRTVEVTIAPEQSPAPQSDAVEPPTASEVFIA